MTLKAAPPLFHCPHCHYQLEKGDNPDGLAWHGCGLWPAQAQLKDEDDEGPAPEGALKLAMDAAADPKLTPQGGAVAYMRVMLYKMATSGDVVGSPGDVFAGIGKFAEASPNDDDGMTKFLRLLAGKEDEDG